MSSQRGTIANPATPQPLTPPTFPPSALIKTILPTGARYRFFRTRIQNAVASTTTTNITTASNPGIPGNAVGIMGFVFTNNTNPVYPVQVTLSVSPDGLSAPQSAMMLCWKGSKSAYGFAPLTPNATVVVSSSFITAETNSPAEAGVINLDIIWVLDETGTPGFLNTVPQAIPFQSDSGFIGEIDFLVSQTSATTTAQTIDIKPLQNVEYELTAAWGYAGAAILTTENYYDGTTAVPIASPASAATFDATPATRRAIVGGAAGVMFRLAAAAPGAGTSTCFVSAIARIKK